MREMNETGLLTRGDPSVLPSGEPVDRRDGIVTARQRGASYSGGAVPDSHRLPTTWPVHTFQL